MTFALLSLPLFLGTAYGAILPNAGNTGVKIPIAKRLNPTKGLTVDGKFNVANARSSVVGVATKYGRTLAAFQSIHGFPHELATEPSEGIAKRQSEALTDEENNDLWAGEITIGNQQFSIDFDTGSSDLWVPSSSCSSCTAKNKYKVTKTGKKQSGTFSISYGDGSTASGPIYTETVTVAGYSATAQTFSPVTSETGNIGSSPTDGILGMAFPAISSLNASPFFNTLISEGVVPAGVFCFKLAETGSELYLGGINSEQYTGDITYVALSSEDYWSTSGSVLVGSKTAVSTAMIIDTGTTLIVGEPTTVATFYKKAKGKACTTAVCGSGSTGFYYFPCASPPKVSFEFSGTTFPVSGDTFNFGQVSEGSSSCIGGVVGEDVGIDSWIVGDVFLRNVYAVFDVDNSRVGFATLA